MLDVLFRGARVYDGSGAKSVTAPVGVREGTIVKVGDTDEPARRTVDAGGLALMPGIVDLHTHYDAQITWDATLSPSVALGVTTAVMGNCGFGIAPCPPAQRETLLRNLSVVEGMDVEALLAGTRWDFESFAQYLAMLERRRPLANLAVLAQHSTIRSAVMGAAASERKAPTDRELAEMRRLVAEALDAGAIGFASSFSPNHSGWGGRPMPSTIAADEELQSLVRVLGEKRHGIFVMATGPRATPEFMEALAADTGRPAFIVTVLAMHNQAQPRRALEMYERCAQALARGHEVYIHANCQPLSFDFTLREPYILYSHDAFDAVKSAPHAERAAIYRSAAFRERLRQNFGAPGQGILFYGDWTQVERDGVPVTELARREGKDALDYVFDLPLDVQLVAKLYQNDDAAVAPLLQHPAGVIALSDAGAHLIYFCDAGYGLHFLAHWVRELGTFTLEEGVRRLTSDPARKYRISGRGLIAPGRKADLVLFDPAKVGVSPLRRVKDLPGGGARMVRDPLGVHGVWVNGVQVFDGRRYRSEEHGPGEVLRNESGSGTD
ncbi:MAG TPA: amidohydrolase family protein [Burkholderiales bacterium]|nr:amidohydrolase family protein [Burkholderiales bacterium]